MSDKLKTIGWWALKLSGAAAFLVVAAVQGNWAFAERPVPASVAEQFAGDYYKGDGLGFNVTLTLRSDGSYRQVWHGCLGPSRTETGKWSVSNKSLLLSPLKEGTQSSGDVKTLDIVTDDKRVVFVRPDDKVNFKRHKAARYYSYRRVEQLKTDRR